MESNHTAYPKNATGPFYVINGCCTACMAPHQQAPSLMGFDEGDGHCFFQRQPIDEQETYQAIRALWSTELNCIRYAGDDPQILRRLVEAGATQLCDQPVPTDVRPLLRSHVSFELSRSTPDVKPGQIGLDLLRRVAESYRDYLKAKESLYLQHKMSSIAEQGNVVVFAYSWAREWHPLTFAAGEPGTDRLLIMQSSKTKLGSTAVSLDLDDWLRSDERILGIRWYTSEAWESGAREWQNTPI